ncbi:unnamed protein product [Linum trigynum]|uniref:FAS1 domain-containing protein n=1 Tax=Linum trigynum TaxID=586398 RepID=A0AAV2G805_9ROSI
MESFFQRWKATIYFTLSTFLAFMAFSIALHSTTTTTTTSSSPQPPSPSPPPATTLPRLSSNASTSLRRAGFSLAASLLQSSPHSFSSSSYPQSTVFAIKDSAFSSSAAANPRLLMKQLLHYHTSPLRLPMSELLKIRRGTRFPTLVPGKNLVLTKIDAKSRAAEINHVKISHPDVVIDGSLVIHGVLEPFSSLDSGEHTAMDSVGFRDLGYWPKIIRSLSSKGFVSFAIGLNSVLDGILDDYRHLNSVTVFSPPDFGSVASSSPMLGRIIRIHILPQRISYKELVVLPDKSPLKTLLPGQDLELKKAGKFTELNVTAARMRVNGVDIVAPEIFSSGKYIVHGISRVLDTADASKKSS